MLFICTLLCVFLASDVTNAKDTSITGSHWIVVPDRYTPGVPIPLTFNFYNISGVDVDVQVDLIRDDHHSVSTLTHTFKGAKSELVQLKVPDTGDDPYRYTLLINGLSGLFFQQHAILYYDSGAIPEMFAIHIQTDKGIYKPGQTVRFRTFGISSDMMVYSGQFNISIYDPKGNQMKKLVNVSEPIYGVVEDFFVMDTEPVLGEWRIKVSVDRQVTATEEKYFKVDKYVLPKFQVSVELPPYVVTTDKEMHGTVRAKYTYGKPVIGTVKLYADIDYSNTPWKYHGDEVMVEAAFDINGEAKFTVPFSRITNEVDPYTFQPFVEKLAGYHLLIKASVTESINNITKNATSQVVFYQEPYKMNFDHSSSMSFFKPGLPYIGHVILTQANGNPIISSTENVRLVSYVKFYDHESHRYRAKYLAEQTYAPSVTGSIEISVIPPVNASSLHLEVFYEGLTDTLNVQKPYWLMDDGNIQISQNSSSIVVGKDAVFNVMRSDGLHHIPFFYAIFANSRMLQTGYLHDNVSNTMQLSFHVTDKMKPYGKLVVYYFDTDLWNADALYFDVKEDANKFKNKVALSFDKSQAEPGENVSLSITSDPQSLVNLLAVDQSVLLLASGNDITQSDVIRSLQPSSHSSADSSELHDPKRVMEGQGFQLLTDVHGFQWASGFHKRQIDCGPYPGLISGQTPTAQPGLVAGQTPTAKPGLIFGSTPAPKPGLLQQVQHTRDFFPETWLWTNLTIGSSGNAILTTSVPDTITSWYSTAFSVNKHSGLGVTDGATKFTTFRPFFISLNLPYSVIRGEQVVLQANVFNYMGQDLDVVVTLEKSADFKVIFNDSNAHVTLNSTEVVKQIHIEAGQAGSVFIPVVADIIGIATITVKAQTPFSADRVKRELIVEAEGKTMHFNVPMIINEHTSVDVPLSFPPTFVADSQKVQISAIGDTMGPTIKNLKSLLRMPTGCGEQTMTSLAPDVFVYNYLKKTNKLTQDVAEMTLDYMYKGYQRELTFQRNDGSFSIWGQRDRMGSMWLTAFVLKSFYQASDYIYVSDSVLIRAASWIHRYQNYDGSFQSKGSVHATNLKGGSSNGYSLSAFVLIALADAEFVLQDKTYFNYANMVSKARRYLENLILTDKVTDDYDLAIISYALSKTGSIHAYKAYTKLEKLAVKTQDGKMHWTVARSQPHSYLSGWEMNYYQSPPLEIEVASYALLYLIDSRQLQTGFPILQWLISQRNSRGGFRSTQDTVLGLQAMSEYGSVFKDILDLTIDVESGSFHKNIHIGKNDAMVLKLLDIPNTAIAHSNNSFNHPPAVSLQGHGTGSALVQVSVSFNVETEVSLPAFNITTTILRETIRSIVVRTCARYLPQRFVNPGMAVIEIDLPSGFSADLESPDTHLDEVKKSEIRDEKTVVLYYDQILPNVYPQTCATVELIRTDLVAKTKPAAIRVFDYYEPDNRALVFFESQLLRDSSYCDICSSCGCP
ncbi:CD109 antigen-like isoform X2 [Ruditapes philippinarum]|uniref:CD109 antigen-like isoform X2 n=1 Tax=Ruditapes philippinarum TaxID=129788 RepID=UPI00295B7BCE|nr:CD109 antigen-like isoform X2 [Ruditapes philippinarum]